MRLTQGTSEWDGIDAVMYDNARGNFSVYEYIDSGYVEMDDWDEVIDANSLTKQLTESTELSNKERKENGVAPLYFAEWIQEPYLDSASATAYWAFKVRSDDVDPSIVVNAKALILSAKGYTLVTAVTDLATFIDPKSSLVETISAVEFVKGESYAEFNPSSHKVAAAGVGALALSIFGVKKSKGLIAGVILFALALLKKAWFLIFLPFIFVWGWIRSKFLKGNNLFSR